MGDYLETLLEQTAGLRAPIAGESPCGADVSLEPEFERVKAELDKLTSIEGGDVDWRSVVAVSEELLGTKTKDLRLAVWLTAGAFERSGWDGLARGLAVCRGLVSEMWEPLLPKRDKARANIVMWLGERVAPKLAELSISLSDGDAVRACSQLADELDRTLADKLGDTYAGVRGFVQTARARVGDIPEPPPPPSEPKASAAADWADDDDDAPAPASDDAPRGGVALSTRSEDADATTRTCGEAMVSLAKSIASAEPTRAWAYHLHRTGIWLPFERVVLDAGVVPGSGPDGETREKLLSLLASARWHELVVAAEEASARVPLWLDPQRLAAIALERMGTAYTDAREAVGRDATDFARRNAHIVEACFSDGAALASPETIAWLEAESARWQLLGGRAREVARDEDAELQRRFADARNLVSAGRHAEGLAIAVQLARRGADTRERFRSSLDVARLAMNAGAHEVARPILEGLLTIASAHSLETWDPSLCARLYGGLYRCLPIDAPDRAKVFEVLCRLDPGAALRARLPLGANGTNGHSAGTAPQVGSSGQAVQASAPTTSDWDDDD
jgi:type VI secretion system protein VasJ